MREREWVDRMEHICFSARPGSEPSIFFATGNHHNRRTIKDLILELASHSDAAFWNCFSIENEEIDGRIVSWLLCINEEAKCCPGRKLMDDMFCHLRSNSGTERRDDGFTDRGII
jgi:hypothetical protein